MIHIPDIVAYLSASGLLDGAAVIGGALDVSALTGRNLNLIVRQGASALLLKQPVWLDDNVNAIRAEMDFYTKILPRLPLDVRAQVPNLVRADRSADVIVIAFIDRAVPLAQLFATGMNDARAMQAIHQLGRFLGAVHNLDLQDQAEGDDSLKDLSREPPWAFRVHRPTPKEFALISPGAYECIKHIQQNDRLCAVLDEGCRTWSPRTLIHGDIRSENVLSVQPGAADGNPPSSICVVDWELVQIGDPAWDIAGFVQILLQHWLSLWTPGTPMAAFDDAAIRSSPFMIGLRNTVRVFLRAYHETNPVPVGLWDRASALIVPRLLQGAVECAHSQTAGPPLSGLILELSDRIARDPAWVSETISVAPTRH
jgi:aminoglycoside phosphotransferase (APT) family kinase protein